MLIQLTKRGFSIAVIGATIFDSPQGTSGIERELQKAKGSEDDIAVIKDGPLTHYLAKTKTTTRSEMTTHEYEIWFSLFTKALDDVAPDIVYFFGGNPLDFLIPIEAKKRGITSVAYLANGNYYESRWCEDVDCILTDSQATASMYKERLGIEARPIGAFIDPEPIVAKRHDPKHILIINPSLEKGAGIVVRLAMLLERSRPDIIFEVVESRGNWHQLVKSISSHYGAPRTQLSNVIITPNTPNMKPIFGRARVLLALSLWWESFGRVVAEAMMNGIPTFTSTSGGLLEAGGQGAIPVQFPDRFHKKPYNKIPDDDMLSKITSVIERLYDDDAFYHSYSQKALKQGKRHKIEVSTQKLINELMPLLDRNIKATEHLHTTKKSTPANVKSIQHLPKHAKIELSGHQGITNGRYGYYFYNSLDSYIGKSLKIYGEYCEHEFHLIKQFLSKGDTFWDVGANFGGLTIPLAQHVGPKGSGVAFEPQPFVFHALSGSVAANNFSHVRCLPFALSSSNTMLTIPEVDYSKAGNYGMVSVQDESHGTEGHLVQAYKGDDLDFLPKPKVIKIDVEGMEESVITGMEKTISSERPVIYTENDRVDFSKSLIEQLWGYDYVLYWHITPYFNAKNFNSVSRNIWPGISSFNMLCIPAEQNDAFKIDLPVIKDSQHHPLSKRA